MKQTNYKPSLAGDTTKKKNMNRKILVAVVASMFLAPFGAHAQKESFKYEDVGYFHDGMAAVKY
jgi:hypothetical protein